ncbi:hypothetical protein NFJ02_22g49270 [Pycnococcus provasolii]
MKPRMIVDPGGPNFIKERFPLIELFFSIRIRLGFQLGLFYSPQRRRHLVPIVVNKGRGPCFLLPSFSLFLLELPVGRRRENLGLLVFGAMSGMSNMFAMLAEDNSEGGGAGPLRKTSLLVVSSLRRRRRLAQHRRRLKGRRLLRETQHQKVRLVIYI